MKNGKPYVTTMKKVEEPFMVLRHNNRVVGELHYRDHGWFFDAKGNAMDAGAELFWNAVVDQAADFTAELKANAYNAGIQRAVEIVREQKLIGMTELTIKKVLMDALLGEAL